MLFASVRSIPVAVLHYYGVGMIVIIGMWHLRSLSGSFHVKSTDGFHGPPPILLKFGTLVGIV